MHSRKTTDKPASYILSYTKYIELNTEVVELT